MGMGTIETVVFNGEDVLSEKPMISLPGNTEGNTGIEITPDDIKKNGTSIIGGFDVSSLYATDENGKPAVGSIALYEIKAQSKNYTFGSELIATVAGADKADTPSDIGFSVASPLRYPSGNLSGNITWESQGINRRMPVGTTLRLLCGLGGNAGIALAIRTA